MQKSKKNLQKSRLARFITAAAVIVLCAYVLFHGVTIGVYKIGDIRNNMHYGLDLTGGVNVVLQAEPEKGKSLTSEKMESTIAAIQKRVDSMGVTGATVTKQGTNRIRVQIPSIQNQQEAIDTIGRTAQLKFVGPDKKTILTGAHVTSAKAVTQKTSSGLEEPVVSLKFDKKGTKAFSDATSKYQGQAITIKLDNDTISSPTVNDQISNGEAVIEGMSSQDDANNLASLIQGGALPIKLKTIQATTVGPTLGANSLNQSIIAGAIGIAAVLVFMLIFYRGLGVIADMALVVFVMLDLLMLCVTDVTLTLSGIAGMILTVGMAVDANVIIFERVKEEAKQKNIPIEQAVDAGFKNAMRSIIDGNVTTLIAGFVLFFMGTGAAQGFAVTLVFGVLISMFTAVVLTRHFLKLFTGSGIVKNKKFYGLA